MNGELLSEVLRLHFDSLVIDMHSDIMVDIATRGLRGEIAVLRGIHIPKLKKGGLRA